MKIALLTSAHPWNDVRIFAKEGRTLATAGFDVSLIAQRECDAVVDGVRCIAIPTMRGRLRRMLLGPLYVLRKAMSADICHFHDPELIPIGLVLKLFGKKVIYDVHENLPAQIAYKYWIPLPLRPAVAKAVTGIEQMAARVFDRIIAATPAIAEHFPAAKTVVVQNFPLLEEFVDPDALPAGRSKNSFGYIGLATEARGINEVIDALGRLDPQYEATLEVAGRFFPDGYQSTLQKSSGWPMVRFHGQLNREQLGTLLARVCAGIVTFLPLQNHVESQPNKMFEYMAAQLPVIASDFPLWRAILKSDGGLGLLVDPADPKSISTAMQWILENPESAAAMGRRGREAVLSRFNWPREADKLITTYRSLAEQQQAGQAYGD